jgi:hypothetical protein
MKNAVDWDDTVAALVKTDVSEELMGVTSQKTAFFIR